MLPIETLSFARADASPVSAALYPCPGSCRGILYLHAAGEDAQAAAEAATAKGAALCALSGERWEADLSPWAAPRAFAKGKDFAGGAPAYLHFLCEFVLPAAERSLGLCTSRRGIAGYSLAGLFALYAAYSCGRFNVVASMSGSLWFDGFAPWLAAHPPAQPPAYAYFSLGSREPKTHDARMAAVGRCTEVAVGQLGTLGAATEFVWEPGGHFQDISGRCARGIAQAAAHL